jgi:hypothetical protein
LSSSLGFMARVREIGDLIDAAARDATYAGLHDGRGDLSNQASDAHSLSDLLWRG